MCFLFSLFFGSTFFVLLSFEFRAIMAERLVNYNKRLFGPGPVARVPAPGIFGYYARKPPLTGFVMCAAHGVTIGLVAGLYYKYAMANPETRQIEEYYKENPPK